MQGCKNVIEDLVLAEAKSQFTQLNLTLQQEIQLNDVITYALNRLPPMYATTQKGWAKLRNRAKSELKIQIGQAVKRSLVAVRRDKLREFSPLPDCELDQVTIALEQLQEILQRPDLTWVEAPHVVYQAMMDRKLKKAVGSTYLSSSRRDAIASGEKSTHFHSSPHPAQASGIFSRGYTNVLEKLVFSIAQNQMKRLGKDMEQRVNLSEVAAYALNRLPPMYATTEKGLLQQRHRAKVELSDEIIKTVRHAILEIAKMPQRSLTPLPFNKMRENQEQALAELKGILKKDDLEFANVAALVQDALEK
jgi:Late competence development protein ComFB